MRRATRTAAATSLQSIPVGSDAVAAWVCAAAEDKKALGIEVIDVRGKVDYADYIIVMSGRSDRQVQAIAKGIEQALHAKHDTRCRGAEGVQQGQWALLDFGDVIVHVFHHEQRGYYDLESLWIDAPRVRFAIAS